MLPALLASAIIGTIAGTTGGLVAWPAAADDAPQQRPQKHGRGRKAPRNAAHLRAVSAKRHGPALRALRRLAAPPASWDSIAKGYVPPIVDQGQCGSCWDFSGTGMVSVAYAFAGYPGGAPAWMFSEQYTLDCGSNGGCSGDDNTTVLQWAESTGLPLSKDYGAYQGRAGRCQYQPSMKLYQIPTWGYSDPSGGGGVTSAADIKASIMAYGCVGCAVAAGAGWDSYSGGVYHGSGNRGIDHDVILVGWDDTKSTTPGKTTWKMRNSWGTSWGDNGYMWIDEGADLIGTESVWCAAPPPPGPPTPPTPPGPNPPPMPGMYWSGTITYQDGMIQSITPATKQPCR